MITYQKILAAAVLALTMLVAPAAANASTGFATSSGTLRAGPGTSYPRVNSVSRGEELVIHGCTSQYTWCDVTAGKDRGWYLGSRIAFDYQGRRVVVSEYGASSGIVVVSFVFTDYWSAYYVGYPWYGNVFWWNHFGYGWWWHEHRHDHWRDHHHHDWHDRGHKQNHWQNHHNPHPNRVMHDRHPGNMVHRDQHPNHVYHPNRVYRANHPSMGNRVYHPHPTGARCTYGRCR
jgi:uncharacterized protein YraI